MFLRLREAGYYKGVFFEVVAKRRESLKRLTVVEEFDSPLDSFRSIVTRQTNLH